MLVVLLALLILAISARYLGRVVAYKVRRRRAWWRYIRTAYRRPPRRRRWV